MNRTIEDLKNDLGDQILSVSSSAGNRYFVELEGPEAHSIGVKCLTDNHHARLITISAMDLPAYYELLYHMDLRDHVITLRTKLWKPDIQISSITGINRAAELIEHEITELFGIEFTGNPRQMNMILDDDTQKGYVPLRSKVSKLDNRIDTNVATIVEHGSTTAPSRRVMKARGKLDMPENPPLCSISCPAKQITYEIAEATGTKARHPNIKKKEEPPSSNPTSTKEESE